MGGKLNSEYLYIKVKYKTMSEEIRKMIDKFKKFKQFVNENNEKRYYHYYGHTIMSVKNGGVFVNKIKDGIDGTPAKKEDYIEFKNYKEAEDYINSLYNY